MKIQQVTPQLLLNNKVNIESYLRQIIESTITENSWMKEWRDVANRFQLFQLMDFPDEELLSYSWDEQEIQTIVADTVQQVKTYIALDSQLEITVVPALPFPWFGSIEQSMWLNGFTNSPCSIWIAVPTNADHSFLRYLLAHELHHSAPENPIYQLTMNQFPLKDWYKMEGTAEYFSLQLFEDKRWWIDDFTSEIEQFYTPKAKNALHTTDNYVKAPLCFGSVNENIPNMAGYSFAYNAVKEYIKRHPINDLNKLFEIDAEELVLSYIPL